MKKALAIGSALLSVALLTQAAATASSSASLPVVGISQLVSAPALDDMVTGIKIGLAKRGWIDGENVKIELQNANGDISVAQTIARKFVGDNVAVIVPITTPSSQVTAKAVRGTNAKMVFAGVSDPVAAGIIGGFNELTHTNITWMYNRNPIQAQMDLAQRIYPRIKRLGVIYNAGEANSVSDVKRLEVIVAKKRWKLVKATVASSNDVLSAARSLVGKVDAMYMPQDNTVNSALDALVKVERQYKLPLFTGDAQSVGNGAIATVGQNNVIAGQQAAGLIASVLAGADPGLLMPEAVAKHQVYVNTEAAKLIGLKIPAAVLATAINQAGKERKK